MLLLLLLTIAAVPFYWCIRSPFVPAQGLPSPELESGSSQMGVVRYRRGPVIVLASGCPPPPLVRQE